VKIYKVRNLRFKVNLKELKDQLFNVCNLIDKWNTFLEWNKVKFKIRPKKKVKFKINLKNLNFKM
jgi:hypothetical protein